LPKHRCLIVVVVLAGLLLPGCARSEALGEASNEAATVEGVAGSDLHRVTLTPDAVAHLGVRAEPARLVPAGASRARTAPVVIPYAAVLYDMKGDTWVYKQLAPRSYLRQHILLDRVDNDLAYVRGGLGAGTVVVTVGAPELLGAEYGVGGE
jgi:hypothetical protein